MYRSRRYRPSPEGGFDYKSSSFVFVVTSLRDKAGLHYLPC